MLIQKEFLMKLKDFGLNSYESKIWTALLSLGMSTAGELSDIANVPRSRSYDVLESLVKKGFIISKTGKPITYIAIPPEEVIERMKNKVQKEADYSMKMIESLKSNKLIEELKALHVEGISLVDPSDLSGSITGRDNLSDHLYSMLKKAKKSITIFTTDLEQERKFLELFGKLKKNHVRVQIAADKKDKEFSQVAEVGIAQQRARFYVVDGKDVLFMLLDDKEVHPNYDTGIWVNSSFFGSVLEMLFKTAQK
ncbi:MAG: hypothetical protein KJ601_01255 [Nanoarchaeota archaeon]|nr:hypothetical protein [Nanoarchaeota archaeon]MBU1704811.1 hypothetical protein [Nanoarchaeota archaeon]